MKKFKGLVSVLLLLCMVVSLLPPVQFIQAAEITQRYELDTDGIDIGATYLIVNTGSAGTGNALRFYYSNAWNRDFRNQSLTIQSQDGVQYIETGFTNEADCQFQFTGAGAGNITHGNYNVDLNDNGFTTGDPSNTLTFTHVGNGQYRIHYTSWWRTYYLRYNNSDWANSTTSSSVYLYKLTDHVVGYDVIYDGNGYTAGTLPENAVMLSAGDEYTVPAPADLRKDIGDDTWLFRCWNTAADGSGTEYMPGETFTITEDVTLYATWYQQTKHTISMITYLDGVATDVDKFAGYDRHFYAVLEGGDGTYIPLTRREEGTYSAKVVDNGTYVVYAVTIDGEYSPVHGHKIIVYNQDSITECMHYSITYDAAGGVWAEGEEPAVGKCHDGETVIASEKLPTKDGYRFLYWKDQDGNFRHPGHPITESADRKITMTAVWEKLITVTVNVTIDHNAANGGADNEQSMHDATLLLLRQENGVNLPVEERVLTSGYIYDAENNTTTYTVVFEDMPQGIYHVTSAKHAYVQSVSFSGNADEDQVIDLNLKYTPENSELHFDVIVNADNDAEKALMPQAVNVKISYWGHNEEDVLGWHIITSQEGNKLPSTVMIDENGKGTGSFTIWPKRSGSDLPYEYRVEVTSFILPDGTIVPASGDLVTYKPTGSGLYEATVSVEGAGRVPAYPDGSDTTLPGAYFADDQQMGTPTVTVEITPLTVHFDAGDGTVNGESSITLENQYRYPALHDYVAIPNAQDRVFVCWTDENGNPVENHEDELLQGDVTYIARYNENFVLSGTVLVDATYVQDGQDVQIYEQDRAKAPVVVLQKKVGDVYNDVASCVATLTYEKNEQGQYEHGIGSYEFKDIPNDGTEYRIQVLTLNYAGTYDNNQDEAFTADETIVQVDAMTTQTQVDVHLEFSPDAYQQAILVNASQIQKDLRPTGALVQLLGRDLGDVHNYKVISQHDVPPYGIMAQLDPTSATATVFEDVWNWHTNGTPYEYQVQVSTVYGNNVTGAYTQEGTAYSENSPFTIVYGQPNNYLKQMYQGGVVLEATLVPKQYHVHLDLNLGDDTSTPVLGLEEFMVDDGTGLDRYVHVHTWSFADQFTAYPYREGYVFKGWASPDTNEVYVQDGTIHVGSTLANHITLTAQWEKLTGSDYTVRYLELNTDKVLQGATAVTGAAAGDTVVAADKAQAIEGYVYVGAVVNDNYIEKTDNPVMTITNDPAKNLMVIYYLPDGSDGYTEQVESNLDINKTAVLEDNGTYTITMDTYTKDNPITTLIQQNTPLDIVLVLDQSGSLAENDSEYLLALQDAVDSFVESIADHGRHNKVDHRIALVGYAGNETDIHSSISIPTGGKESDTWINTGVFDSNGEYHLYNVNGFNYTELTDTSTMTADGIYYTKVTVDGQDKFLLLTHHDEYRHLITEEEARLAQLQGEKVFGYVYNQQDVGSFVELSRNSSGLWLYGNKQLYSQDEFFTYHTDVWTHRDGTQRRQIHAYGVGAAYNPTDGHEGVYTREETTGDSFQQSIYQDALIPVSVGAAGSGGTNPGLLKATQSFGADGATRASYGMEMANEVLKANPVDEGEGRVRLVVMFTDGEPGYMGFDSSSGDEYYQQAVTEANNAIAQAYITKNTYDAYVYTIGLYESAGVDATSEVAYYMNALSSNYPNAQSMDDIKAAVTYTQAADGTVLQNNGKFYVLHNNSGSTYYEVKYGYVRVSYRYQYCWYYTRNNTNYAISTTNSPAVSGGRVGNFNIYQQTGGYAATEYSGYYATTESSDHLKDYFDNVMKDITTKITTEIILHNDTILRDIMGQGLVMTDGTVITVYTQEGNYDLDTGNINWSVDANGDPILEEKVSLELGSGQTTAKDEESGVAIYAYNLDAQNPTDPTEENYHPHTVDITGYNFSEWFISEEHTKGYKMVVTITRVEARDDVKWGRSVMTNNEQSGLWLPADENGNRQLLLPFDQPTTIFVERAYVLDYGKEFTLSGWYFDDEEGKDATPVHVDCDIANGMNWFDPQNPNTANAKDSDYGNTTYGNVKVEDGTVTYSPTTMNWGGYDQFYVFGDTWRKTVLAQDANQNGNLWNKVTVIPANNIYYEDSFITTDSDTQNGIEGFTFTGAWSTVGTDDGNTENPEHMESDPYGDVHGWTDSLGDDVTYTDGTAHVTGLNKEMGAKAEFTFTGTGVEVYTRTNAASGIVVAILNKKTTDGSGNETTTFYKSIAMDNLAMSGDYYHTPTVAFKQLPYGTYSLQLIATVASTGTQEKRYEYYIDGVRIHNPLGSTTNYQSDIVKDAYGLETNAVYTEVRDILLQYQDFNVDMPDGTDGKTGAVFIDWIQDGQGSGNDNVGTAQPSYEVGTFEAYGPKNEVYLSAGQAIVLKVAEGNNYYVGLKSLTGAAVTANISGIDQADPTAIQLSHTTDMYYQVIPVNGYIVIQNGNADNALLSITNLRTTNLTAPAENGGILPVAQQEAVAMMETFSAYLLEKQNQPEPEPQPTEPEEELPSAQEQADKNLTQANSLFTSVRQWLETN